MSKKPFRVLQLIDSLNPGGSERMAVQLANVLSDKIECSAIVSTRQSGALENDIKEGVIYAFLKRKSRFDVSAINHLKSFIEENNIQIIHAHGTSFFIASIVKLLKPTVKLIWHDHYGFRYQTRLRNNLALYFCSSLFNHIIAINRKLSKWSKSNLKCKSISCIANFSIKPTEERQHSVRLKGSCGQFKIIHLANLRPEKDHITALNAIKILLDKGLDVSYHSIGIIDKSSSYYKTIEKFLDEKGLKQKAFFYDSQTDIYGYLKKADLGLLSSISEGFPLSLIEYANAKLPVVVTDVGNNREIVGEFGEVVLSKSSKDLAIAIEKNIKDIKKSKAMAIKLHEKVNKTYHHKVIVNKILDIYTLY